MSPRLLWWHLSCVFTPSLLPWLPFTMKKYSLYFFKILQYLLRREFHVRIPSCTFSNSSGWLSVQASYPLLPVCTGTCASSVRAVEGHVIYSFRLVIMDRCQVHLNAVCRCRCRLFNAELYRNCRMLFFCLSLLSDIKWQTKAITSPLYLTFTLPNICSKKKNKT